MVYCFAQRWWSSSGVGNADIGRVRCTPVIKSCSTNSSPFELYAKGHQAIERMSLLAVSRVGKSGWLSLASTTAILICGSIEQIINPFCFDAFSLRRFGSTTTCPSVNRLLVLNVYSSPICLIRTILGISELQERLIEREFCSFICFNS